MNNISEIESWISRTVFCKYFISRKT